MDKLIGLKVVCCKHLKGAKSNIYRDLGNTLPSCRDVLTIRTVSHDKLTGKMHFRFEEIINPKLAYTDAVGEVEFPAAWFRFLTEVDFTKKLAAEFFVSDAMIQEVDSDDYYLSPKIPVRIF